jgi:hypothetical protein
METPQKPIAEPTANVHFDAFSEPRTIPAGWNVSAFMGSALDHAQPYQTLGTQTDASGEFNAVLEDPQNPVS